MTMITRRAFGLLAAAAAVSAAPFGHADEGPLLSIAGPGLSVEMSRADLEAMPQHVIETATNFTDGRPAFRGPLLADALRAAGVESGAALKLTAANDYAIEIPFSDIAAYGPILAMEVDGVTLTPRSRGPIWVMYPVDGAAAEDRQINDKLIWQLTRIEVL